jgi:hypothetical protein
MSDDLVTIKLLIERICLKYYFVFISKRLIVLFVMFHQKLEVLFYFYI